MNVGLTINKKELAEIARNLESLNMSDSKNKTLLRQAMRKAAKPILSELKSLVPKDSGQLRKSLAIISGKNVKNVAPSVFVGPRVKGGKKIDVGSGKKTKKVGQFETKEKSGFYFYFLEYGFRGIPGLRMLDQAARSKGSQALNDVTNQLKALIEKRFKK
jgi:HK97 gp10 family phage protein